MDARYSAIFGSSETYERTSLRKESATAQSLPLDSLHWPLRPHVSAVVLEIFDLFIVNSDFFSHV